MSCWLTTYATGAPSDLQAGLAFIHGHAATAFRQPSSRNLGETTVERINVVEKDGRLRMVIANSERQTTGMVNKRTLAPNRKHPAGVIFFNDEGDEDGGLTPPHYAMCCKTFRRRRRRVERRFAVHGRRGVPACGRNSIELYKADEPTARASMASARSIPADSRPSHLDIEPLWLRSRARGRRSDKDHPR
jgi:hypothetical protein